MLPEATPSASKIHSVATFAAIRFPSILTHLYANDCGAESAAAPLAAAGGAARIGRRARTSLLVALLHTRLAHSLRLSALPLGTAL